MTEYHQSSTPPAGMQTAAYDAWQPTHTTQLVGPPRRRIPGWILAVAVATAVASVLAFVTVLVWPGSSRHTVAGPLAFHGFASVGGLTFDERSRTTMTAVHHDQAYVAWEQGGDLQVRALDIATGAERWSATVTGAPRWHRLIASPHALLVLADEPSASAPRPLYALDPDGGAQLWETQVHGNDRFIFTEGSLGLLDREGERLRGIDWHSGDDRWQVEAPGPAYATGVNTPASLAQPTSPTGVSLSPDSDDNRIVLVTGDRSVRVVETRDGGTIADRANVADADNDLLLAYENRLFVAQGLQNGYRVESYDLDNFSGSAQVIYTASDPERQVEALEPCGEERVCVLDQVRFDDETTAAAALDAVDGGEVWRTDVPGGQYAIPVGEWLLVNGQLDGGPEVTVLSDAGDVRVGPEPGSGVRANDGNLLMFAADPRQSDAEVQAAGLAVGTAAPEDLGRLPAVDPATCNWSDRFVICTSQDSASIWRFAE
ncbi:PQQ-binding-like beta-propeller repeat protein [Natronosporangium hydrolyticum]|uniref:PQQ-binding-like beta-propeller repeat protein n=1 Tax=Natronosporangium hydrolyticum TaxID=2811111 RepID=A0A895YAH5_9ACTN|nr:PQQ-like beta-propeller repeat protein [Natronosporangium hydrolyticum]QSB14381.1 PQQ-binding-like beta-propeller repeat protein [Natronosporangium hydrolyticum]